MRCFVLITIMVCFLALTWSAAIEQLEAENGDAVYDVPQGGENIRQARQFFGGYYGRPYGGFYGRPYGGYYGRPYGGFYGRPYGGFGGYGGFGYPGFGGGFYG